PYLPLRQPLRGVLGVTETDRAQAGAQVLDTMLALLPDRVGLAPLLAPVLDVDVAPTPESAAIAEEFIRDRQADLLVALLASAAGTALTIIAEDAHWFDDATARICDRFCISARE